MIDGGKTSKKKRVISTQNTGRGNKRGTRRRQLNRIEGDGMKGKRMSRHNVIYRVPNGERNSHRM